MQDKWMKRVIKIIVFFIPFVFGVIGFRMAEGAAFNDALFYSIGFYTLNNMDPAENIFIEMARWTAPLMTAGGLVMAVAAFQQRFRNYFTWLRGGSVAVYGAAQDTAVLLAQLGKRGISVGEGERFQKAERYILMGREKENFLFYQNNYDRLAGKQVYLKCTSMNGRMTEGNVNLFFEEEIAARIFWKERNIYREAKEKDFRMSIVFPEFGVLEEQLLVWGLQNNIFHPAQRISYHIFGDAGKFRAVYHELSQIEEPIVFHDEPWYEAMDLFGAADRIIVCDAGACLNDILFAVPEKVIDVLVENSEEALHYEGKERLRLFEWKKEAEKIENILEEGMLKMAKSINLRYAHLYTGVAETEENLDAEWGKLNTFTKYSNISAADYHKVRLLMIDEWKKQTGREEIDGTFLRELAELEHIRWNRYHYLNNWKYGIPESGKNKDAVKRIHRDLAAFSELTEAEKDKDAENIRVLLSVKAV